MRTPACLADLGGRIADFIEGSFPRGTNVPRLDFDGSLAPLTRLADIARRVCPNFKYVVIIDEFDEIHPELYMHGNLAESFFANLRAITMCDNICIILVGGENMPFVMDCQGQKLNRLVKIGLDYYSRDTEWDDFKLLVKTPTEGRINWHDDAVAEIFNATNGNPWFAKAVCASVFMNAVRARDSDITADEVRSAIATEVSTFGENWFMHLWQDGIYKAREDRAPDMLRRRRVLVAMARAIRRDQPLTWDNIIANKQSSDLPNTEVLPVLHDFVRRDILRERHGQYGFAVPIFRLWLGETGISCLAGDALAEELASGVRAAEKEASVKSEEVSALARRWSTYQGREIGTDDIRAWYEQVDEHRHQRLLFKILQNLRFFSEAQIRQNLQTVHYSFILPLLGPFVIRRRSDRRMDVVVTYVDGEGKSGQYYASRYAEENSLDRRCVISPVAFSKTLQAYVTKNGNPTVVTIIDDIIATGQSLVKNLASFVDENGPILRKLNVPLIIIALAATADGEAYVRTEIRKIDWLDFDLRVCDPLSERDFAFSKNGIWRDTDELERAKALCTNLGASVYRDNPLGYGGQGLLVADTCPNNSLPILHSCAHPASMKNWTPLFPRLVN